MVRIHSDFMLVLIPWFTASRCFDLSQNKCLRTLETTALSIDSAGDTASGFLKTVLSTITPSLPLEVVITYGEKDVGLEVWGNGRPGCKQYCIKSVTHHSGQFKVIKEMYAVRKFRLLLCADVTGWAIEHSMEVLERAVAGEKAGGGLDYLECEPLIISEVRAPRTRLGDYPIGGTMHTIVACVL